jgi:hypothetical protein
MANPLLEAINGHNRGSAPKVDAGAVAHAGIAQARARMRKRAGMNGKVMPSPLFSVLGAQKKGGEMVSPPASPAVSTALARMMKARGIE